MKVRAAAVALCCTLGLAADGRAQIAWDSPLLLPPNPTAGTGIYLMDAHRGGLGVLGTWRGPGQGTGFRLGIAEGRGGNGIGVLGGLDMVFPLARAAADFPLDLSWLIGVGAGYDDYLLASVPLGLTLGRTFDGGNVRFTPYLSPRVNLDAALGRDNGNAMDLNLAVDLGVDVGFQPGWILRIGASIGGRDGVAVGIQF